MSIAFKVRECVHQLYDSTSLAKLFVGDMVAIDGTEHALLSFTNMPKCLAT